MLKSKQIEFVENINLSNAYRIINSADPVDGKDLVNKDYVDNNASASWGNISGLIENQIDLQYELASKKDTFVENTGFNKNFGTTAGTVAEGNHTHDRILYSGGSFVRTYIDYVSISHYLDMNNTKIINIAACTDQNDAANKKYVDDTIADTAVVAGSGLTDGIGNINLGGIISTDTTVYNHDSITTYDYGYKLYYGNTNRLLLGDVNLTTSYIDIQPTTTTISSSSVVVLAKTNNGSSVINVKDSLENSVLNIYDDGHLNASGLINYNSDLSSSYTIRSLVDKGYVDSVASSYIFTNGLTESGGTVKLGNFITEETYINLGAFNFGYQTTAGLQPNIQTIYSNSQISLRIYENTEDSSITVLKTGVSLSTQGGGQINLRAGINDYVYFDENKYGLYYSSDFSATFVDRSLVDKGYVDSLVLGTANVYTNGLTELGGTAKLGGTLIETTSINLDDNTLNFITGTENDNLNFGAFGTGNQLGSISTYALSTVLGYDDGTNQTYVSMDASTIDIYSSDGDAYVEFYMTYQDGFSYMEFSDGIANTSSIYFSSTEIEVGFNSNSIFFNDTGAYYSIDLSSGYTNRHLVDKEYVDTNIASLDTFTQINIVDTSVNISTDIYSNLVFEDPNAGILTLSDLVITAGNGLTKNSNTFVLGGLLENETNIELAANTLNINYSIVGFSVGTGFDTTVYSVGIQSDSKAILGGNFTSYNGTSINRIVRLNVDGSIDSSFVVGTGFNAVISKIRIQSDGKIIVVGNFTSYNGTSINRIIRLNTDGSIDTSFTVGTGFDGYVQDIAIHSSSGKLAAVGNFTTYNSVSSKGLIMLNSDGTRDTGFSVGTGLSTYGSGIDFQTDGKVIVVCPAPTYNGVTTNYIFRANTDGSIDSSFNVGTGLTSGNSGLVKILSDGKVMIGGQFTSYNGTSANNIIKLNSDGSIDTSFVIGTGLGSYPEDIQEQIDNKIIIVGAFTAYNNVNSPRLARVNTDGSLDTSFINGTMLDSTAYGVAIYSDGKIITCGQFLNWNGITSTRVVRLNSDGSINNVSISRKTIFSEGLAAHSSNLSAYYTNRTLPDKEYVDNAITSNSIVTKVGSSETYTTISAAITAGKYNLMLTSDITEISNINISANTRIDLNKFNLTMDAYEIYGAINTELIITNGKITFAKSDGNPLFRSFTDTTSLLKVDRIIFDNNSTANYCDIADYGYFNDIVVELPNLEGCGFGHAPNSFYGTITNAKFIGGGTSCLYGIYYASITAKTSQSNLSFEGTWGSYIAYIRNGQNVIYNGGSNVNIIVGTVVNMYNTSAYSLTVNVRGSLTNFYISALSSWVNANISNGTCTTAFTLNSTASGMKLNNVYFRESIVLNDDNITLTGCNVGSVTSGVKTITINAACDKTIIIGCRTEADIVDNGTNTELNNNVLF